MPSLIGALGVELIGLNGFVETSDIRAPTTREDAVAETSRVVTAVGADIGVVMDVSAERIWLVDDQGGPLDAESTLLLLLQEIAGQTDEGDLLVPIVETSLVETVVDGASHRITRTKASLGDLLAEAAGAARCSPAPPAAATCSPPSCRPTTRVMSTCKVLEVLSHAGRPLSELAAGIPVSARVHDVVHCPWSRKGTVMRMLIESVKGMEVDDLDGVKVFEEQGWVQAIPDPDEPYFHLWAEGATPGGFRAPRDEISRDAASDRQRNGQRSVKPSTRS